MTETPLTKQQNTGLLRYLVDQILAALQKRCEHPGQMVAVDILAGCDSNVEVAYCRRCGAVKTTFVGSRCTHAEWMKPDPNLWRGR